MNARSPTDTVYALLFALSFSHLLNDTVQALLPSVYPLLRESHALSFTQIGLITLAFNGTACLLQPLVGYVTDRRPMPFSLPLGMGFTLAGLVALAFASSFTWILSAASLIGAGSSIFHPEASRIAHMAAGRRKGLAQSLFQVGGNAGSSLGPLAAALVVVPHGQRSLLWFSVVALVGVLVLSFIGRWQGQNLHRISRKRGPGDPATARSRPTVVLALVILVVLTFSKYVYLVSLTNFYTFFLINRFHVTIQSAQLHLFLLLLAVAVGTIAGGPVGDRLGRKRVIWISILGVAPFSIWLPHASLGMTAVLSVLIGLILASAFSAILVYAQELLPGRVGMIAGLFFGLAFGIGGIGAGVLGSLADRAGINVVFEICAYLPLLGLLTAFLPNVQADRKPASA